MKSAQNSREAWTIHTTSSMLLVRVALREEFDRTSTSIAPVVVKTDGPLQLTPGEPEEIAALLAVMPPILQACAALRDSLPALVAVSQVYRTPVPRTLTESVARRSRNRREPVDEGSDWPKACNLHCLIHQESL